MTGLFLAVAVAAFEPQSESPWLSGGAAAALFPRTHLSISSNPASIGLLELPAVAVSGSRPFGFKELDRTAVAGGNSTETFAWGGFASYSGRNGYMEATLTGAGAFTLSRGIIAGVSTSFHRISIEGFGGSNAVSADLGVIARPVGGVFLACSCRGLYSSSPAADGRGAVPRTVSSAVGVCPVEGVTLSAGASMHQYADEEFSLVTSVEPYPGVVLSAGLLTPPVRMGFGLHLTVSSASLQYGYATHADLPPGHSICLSWGGGGFQPRPMNFTEQLSEEAQVSYPLNVNTATPEELMTIPGIGPSKASLIRNYIEMHGRFETIDELVEVPGIGPATLENLRPYLTV